MKTVLRWCMSPQLVPLLLPIAGKKKETATRKQHPEQASIEQA